MKLDKRNRLRRVMPVLIVVSFAGCSLDGISNPIKQISNPIEQQPTATFQAAQIVGGATKQMTEGVQPVGGFLPQPELLVPGGPGQAALVYLNPKISGYRKVLLEPVRILAGPDSGLNGVPVKQQQALANALYADLYKALNGSCRLVKVASPNTIRMRFALVDAKIPNATINTVATYTPYASTAYSVASLVFNKGVGYFAGTATGEGFATDAIGGSLLWEAVDKRGGTTALVADTLDNWRDVRHVFEAWGTQLRTRLQHLGVC